MTTKSGFWGPLRKQDFIIGIICFFILGTAFGIAIGLRIEQNKIDPGDREAIEQIIELTELTDQLDRVLTIYNDELEHILQNYQQAMKILNERR